MGDGARSIVDLEIHPEVGQRPVVEANGLGDATQLESQSKMI
jgi:hypothetical protein